jgi:pimeloyl-ACP methyl ester carboxylesterase
VLDALGLDRVPVVGMSMGGFVALTLRHRHPERVASLTLVDGGFPLTPPRGSRRTASRWPSPTGPAGWDDAGTVSTPTSSTSARPPASCSTTTTRCCGTTSSTTCGTGWSDSLPPRWSRTGATRSSATCRGKPSGSRSVGRTPSGASAASPRRCTPPTSSTGMPRSASRSSPSTASTTRGRS